MTFASDARALIAERDRYRAALELIAMGSLNGDEALAVARAGLDPLVMSDDEVTVLSGELVHHVGFVHSAKVSCPRCDISSANGLSGPGPDPGPDPA